MLRQGLPQPVPSGSGSYKEADHVPRDQGLRNGGVTPTASPAPQEAALPGSRAASLGSRGPLPCPRVAQPLSLLGSAAPAASTALPLRRAESSWHRAGSQQAFDLPLLFCPSPSGGDSSSRSDCVNWFCPVSVNSVTLPLTHSNGEICILLQQLCWNRFSYRTPK